MERKKKRGWFTLLRGEGTEELEEEKEKGYVCGVVGLAGWLERGRVELREDYNKEEEVERDGGGWEGRCTEGGKER